MMYECQRYAAARESINEQMRDFSIARAECFDETDRPRVEREIAKWFGNAGERLFRHAVYYTDPVSSPQGFK